MRKGLLLSSLIVLSLSLLASSSTWGAPLSPLHYLVFGQGGFSQMDRARLLREGPEEEAPRRVLNVSPKVAAMVGEGEVALGERRLDDAVSALQKGLDQVRPDRDPETYAGILTLLGMTQLLQSNVDGAEQYFAQAQSVLEAHLHNASAHMTFLKVGQAGAAHARGDEKRVEQLVQEILQRFPPRISPPDTLHFLSRLEMSDFLWLLNLPKAAEPYLRAEVQAQEAHPELEPDIAAKLSLQFAKAVNELHKGESVNLGPDGKPTDEPSEIERYAARTVQLLGGPAATGLMAEMAFELTGQEQLIRHAWVPAMESLQHARMLGRGRPVSAPLGVENAELAEAYAGQNRLPDALSALDEAIQIEQSLLPATGARLGKHLRRKAELQCANEHCVAAIDSAKAAEALLITLSDPVALARCRSAQAVIFQVAGTLPQAVAANQAALDDYRQVQPPTEEVGLLHQQRGELLLGQHLPAAALDEFQAARTIFSHLQPVPSRAIADTLAYEAVSRYEQGNRAEAVADARAQWAVYEHSGWPWSIAIAAAVRVVGLHALETHDTLVGLNALERAWEVRQRAVTGGEVTIAQGWELAEALRPVTPAARDAVIGRLHEMLVDSPEVSAELRAQVTAAWTSAREHPQQTPPAAAETPAVEGGTPPDAPGLPRP